MLKVFLCEYGFTEAWQEQGVGDVKKFIVLLKERLINKFTHEWENLVVTSDRYEFYAKFKRILKLENYPNYNQLRCYKIAYIQFRLGISPIKSHQLRYIEGATDNQLLCPVCRTTKENEMHVLFDCPGYQQFRDESTLFNNGNDVCNIMNACSELNTCQLSRFLYKVFKKRAEFM